MTSNYIPTPADRASNDLVEALDIARTEIRATGSLIEGGYAQALYIVDNKDALLALISAAQYLITVEDQGARANGESLADIAAYRKGLREGGY